MHGTMMYYNTNNILNTQGEWINCKSKKLLFEFILNCIQTQKASV